MKQVKEDYDLTINIEEGICAFVPGPESRTLAEVKVLDQLGVDVITTSLVPEAIVANYMGLDVLRNIIYNKYYEF